MKKGIFFTIFILMVGLGFSGQGWAADEGVTDTEIVIGCIVDLSGAVVSLGMPIKNGMNMRVKEVNDAGGIHGRKIRLVVVDDGYDPKKTVMAANRLITRERVIALVGNLGTAPTMAAVPICKRSKVPLLFPSAFREELYDPPNRYIFLANPSYVDQARTIATYFTRDQKKKRFGLLYQDDDLVAEFLKGVRDGLEKFKLKLIAAEPAKPGATDFSSQIAKLKKADIDMLVLACTPRETVGALKEVKKIGWDLTICSSAAAATNYVVVLAQKSGFSTDGVYIVLNHCDFTTSDDPFYKDFCKRYQEMFNIPAVITVLPGYESAHFFALAAERAGRNLNREKLIDALETFKAVPSPLCGPPISFGPDRHIGSRAYFMAQFQGMAMKQITGFIE